MAKRIEIAGIIASGKTTLARVLADSGIANAVLESFSTNPFYEAFYRDPSACAFETEVTFLLQHYHAIHTRDATKLVPVVCDFSVELDSAYAATTLTDDEVRTFSAVRTHVTRVIGEADLIVALDCRPGEALRRIQERGRAAEGSITIGYLDALSASLHDKLKQTSGKVLKVNSEMLDFSVPGDAQASVVRRIAADMSLLSLPT